MLSINTYTQDYIDECRARVHSQLAVYQALVAAARQQTATNETPLNAAIDSFEPVFFNNMILMLDYMFVHRSRTMEKKDGNPLNEVRLLCNALLTNNGKMSADKTVKLDPAKSLLKVKVGDEIKLNEADFLRIF
ncbi:MAG: hypothetical protein H7Y09_01215, partial [Chitinophagaceae bacterium]|nr:hypothetical protein [Anaerolineae bacterium]